MSNRVIYKSGGAFPLLSILTALFAAAKVFGYSNMSWLWVFSPIWIPFAIMLSILGFAAICYALAALLSRK